MAIILQIWRGALIAVLLASVPCVSLAMELTGRIVGVIDGDTVDLLTDGKTLLRVRLAGIDAPERGQPFGSAAKRALSDMVFSKRAVLKGEKRDRYGRLIAKVMVDGQDANLQLVQRGYAWHFKKYENEQSVDDRRLYDAAQRAAMRLRVGLWSDPAPVAPWDFRSGRKGKRQRGEKVSAGERPVRLELGTLN